MGAMEYVQECGYNYLRIQQGEASDYRMKILLQNEIRGFLRVEFRQVDEEAWLYARVGGLQSLRQGLEQERLGEHQLRAFFQSLEQVCTGMEEYLLPFSGLVVNPDYIYVRINGSWEFFWAYGNCMDEEDKLEKLLEYLLEHLDFADREASAFLYPLYQAYQNGGNGLSALRECYREMLSGRGWEKEVLRRSGVVQEKGQTPPAIQGGGGMKGRTNPRGEDEKYKSDEKHGRDKRWEREKKKKSSGLLLLWCQIKEPFRRFWEKKVEVLPFVGRISGGGANLEPAEEEAPGEEGAGYVSHATTLLTGAVVNGGVYCLRALCGGEPDILLTEFPFVIGKAEEKVSHILPDSFASRLHARIDREEERFWLIDLNSTNGTFLNRERLTPYERVELREGDHVVFGRREYEFRFLY